MTPRSVIGFLLLCLGHFVPRAWSFQPATLTQQARDVDLEGVNQQFAQYQQLPLQQLSASPLLFTSTQPLLTSSECQTLSNHFGGRETSEGAGEYVLAKLQSTLDHLLARDSQEGPVTPRFLQYEPTLAMDAQSTDELLPDGLHVDTNNGKLFRYLTVLVYLTDSQSSATAFPLAVPLGSYADESLVHHAQSLLNDNIHHTGFAQGHPSAPFLHQAALNVYSPFVHNPVGLRVLPQQGHIVAFWNIDPATGDADPCTWHGAEALKGGDAKEVLTFFYEVPLEKVGTSRVTFGEEVGRRKEALLQLHQRSLV